MRPGYSGVAIYSKTEPDAVSVMGVPEFDTEGRVLDARCGSLHVISAYFPNSQEAGARLDYKLAFCRAMRAMLMEREMATMVGSPSGTAATISTMLAMK